MGKLEFVAVIEAGVAMVKKSEVKDVKEAASPNGGKVADSRFEEVDVSSWLDEAEQFERPGTETMSRNFELPTQSEEEEHETVLKRKKETKSEANRKQKKKPGKLPK